MRFRLNYTKMLDRKNLLHNSGEEKTPGSRRVADCYLLGPEPMKRDVKGNRQTVELVSSCASSQVRNSKVFDFISGTGISEL